MCGLAGFLTQQTDCLGNSESIVRGMVNAVAHRGPDDEGVWTDTHAGIALGHQRLSVVDLSGAGHQPMLSKQGRYVLVFNGEIYNHLVLRQELEFDCSNNVDMQPSQEWKGHSDTETLLAAIETWGIEETLNKTVGMFAIALWDKLTHTLTLVRDRFGEKPLYYGWAGETSNKGRAFVFGSELKSLQLYPGFTNPVNRNALAQYMRFMVVPAPLSIYEDVYKLEPGHLLTFSLIPGINNELSNEPKISQWWSLENVVSSGLDNPLNDESEAIELLEQRLIDAVQLQSLADVPLGAFLSGGVDSSLIVALMQKQSMHPVKTFTVGFEESGFDEAPYAKAVAKHLGSVHSELYVSSAQAQEVIPKLPVMYDEPFADSSQIPTHLVSRAASEQVTVALSGDGADELFGGYNRYFWGPRIWSKLSWMPFRLRQALGRAITLVPVEGWDAASHPINALLRRSEGIVRAGDKAHKLAARLTTVQDLDDLYISLITEWQDPASIVQGVGDLSIKVFDGKAVEGLDAPQRMMLSDSKMYLPDDILCKVDRAAMSVSLETRIPFLDHRVAELAWRLPLHLKIRNNLGKWSLRQILYKYVPRELIDRPKAGFGIPIGQWLRGPLRPWAESLLDESKLQAEGYFYPGPIREKWREHLAGHRDHTASLWAVLMFQAWLAHAKESH